MDRRNLFKSAAALLLTPLIKANIVSSEYSRLLSAKARNVSGVLQYGETLKPFPEYSSGCGSDLDSYTHESLPYTSFTEEGRWVAKQLDSPASSLNFYNYSDFDDYPEEIIVYLVSLSGVHDCDYPIAIEENNLVL